jgi:protein-tyrosine-phosphatase
VADMKVLFVCSGNAYRSPVAEALLKKLRADVKVDSAGVHPMIPISGAAKEYLAKEEALNYLKHVPESLEDKRLDEYDLIVAMTQEHKNTISNKCSKCANKIIVWNIDDPYFLPNRHTHKIFDQIKKKVIELADSLSST